MSPVPLLRSVRGRVHTLLRDRRAAREVLPRRPLAESFELAKGWVRAYTVPGAGIQVSSEIGRPYPEVTGQMIPSLLAWGERPQAVGFAEWLLSVQNADGSWNGYLGRDPYTFDTGQVMRGLLHLAGRDPGVEEALGRAGEWMLTQIEPTGRVGTPSTELWGIESVTDRIHLHCMAALREVGRRTGNDRFVAAAERARDHYLNMGPRLTAFDTLSHFHAYVIQGLVDLGERAAARAAMDEVAARQRRNGSIAAYPTVPWVCVPAQFQYAALWYQLGDVEPADRAFDYGAALQRDSGGFLGCHGEDCDYSPTEEPSWAVLYFFEALQARLDAFFAEEATRWPDTIDGDDGRFVVVARELAAARPRRILDLGCGSGRFANRLVGDGREVHGVDRSPAMLARVDPAVTARVGTMLDIPYADGYFDFVYCVETLEHAVDVDAALREMARVTRRGGTVVVIDKNLAALGHFEMPEWEQWFDVDELCRRMGRHGMPARPEVGIGYDGRDGSDGVFVAWIARRDGG